MQSSTFLCLSQARTNWEGCGRKGIWCKNRGIDGGGLLIGPDGVAPSRLSMCLPLVILPSTIKSRRSFLLAPAHPGGSRQRVVKQLWQWWHIVRLLEMTTRRVPGIELYLLHVRNQMCSEHNSPCREKSHS